MSCHSTSGGIVSTSLARGVTGLTEKEIQHIFHSLKREAQGMSAPSEMDVLEWRARQYDLLSRMKRMTDKRRDKLRDRLFRSRSEPVPDGATFHAWATVEARARQEAALRKITTAVDLDPPGSQAHLYDLGSDGRPKRVWYASYGSNLHRDRFMNYIQGGSPEGSTRTYDGCTDPTEPLGDIPIRFAGARPHFALTSRVWRGGIAFIDPKKGESAHGLGRAYNIGIDQFDDVIAQENGLPAKFSSPVPLDEVLATGRSVIGNGSYETLLHIGDYDGAPVLTFTAPFTTREALTRSGHIVRQANPKATPVRMPVMTNKPSPAYLRMIGGGLQETFDMDEVAQADYLRGCPGGDRWTRQQMVRILRGEEPDPPREPGPESPQKGKGTGSAAVGKTKNKGKGKNGKQGELGFVVRKASTDPTPGRGDKPERTATGGGTAAVFSHKDDTEGASRAADGAILADLRARGLFPAAELPDRNQNRSPSAATRAAIENSPSQQSRNRSSKAKQPSAVRVRRGAAGERELPKVKRYASVQEQEEGVRRWKRTVRNQTDIRNSIAVSVETLNQGLAALGQNGDSGRVDATRRNLEQAQARLAEADLMVSQAQDRLRQAQSQRPARFYSPRSRSLGDWRDEDRRLVEQHQVIESHWNARTRELSRLRADPRASDGDLEKVHRHVTRLRKQLDEHEARLQETHEIVMNREYESGK